MALLAVAALLITLLALGGASYAWFSHNSNASTSKISAKASDADAKLLLSLTESPFNGQREVDLSAAQIAESGSGKLMPVSTSDLVSFVYNSGVKMSGENDIFHAVIYVKAEGDESLDQRLAVYLDDTEGQLFTGDAGSLFLNAGRLGLLFEGKSPFIAALSDEHNSTDKQTDNTKLNGADVARGKVLHMDAAGNVSAVDDPVVRLASAGIKSGDAKAVAVIAMNKVYRLDIYFYLEGTDPDCSSAVELNKAKLHLAFFGELTDAAEE